MKKQGFIRTCAALAAFLAIGFPAATAETVTWTGSAGDNLYVTAENWTVGESGEHRAPTVNDTAVFDLGSGVTLNLSTTGLSDSSKNLPSLRVVSGTVNVSGSRFTAPDNDTREIEVADGATLSLKNRVTPGSNSSLRKTGKGDLLLANSDNWIDVSKHFAALQVDGGQVRRTKNKGPLFEQIVIADGATFEYSTTVDNNPNMGFTEYEVRKGGTLVIYAVSNLKEMRGIRGEGTVRVKYYTASEIQPLRFNLSRGPYRFKGKVEKDTWDNYVGVLNYKADTSYPASEEERHFVIENEDAFSNLLYFKAGMSPDFARGIGSFYLPPLTAVPGVTYVLEDEDGEPIRLYANFYTGDKTETGAATVELEGAGDWFLRSGATTITGDQVRVTGTVGVPSGATLNLGNGIDAAADVSAMPFAAIENAGTVNVSNVAPATLAGALKLGGTYALGADLTVGSMSGSAACTVKSTQDAKLTAGKLDVTMTDKSLTLDGATLVVKGGEGFFPSTSGRLALSNGAKLRLEGHDTRLCAAYSLFSRTGYTISRPSFMLFSSPSSSSFEIADGATLSLGRYDAKLSSFSLVNGGCLNFYDGAHWKTADNLTMGEVFSDGGVIGIGAYDSNLHYDFPASSEADKWVAKVGRGGLEIRYLELASGRIAPDTGAAASLVWSDFLKTVSDPSLAEADGGVMINAAGTLSLVRPQNVTGSFTLRDGRAWLTKRQLEACDAGDSLCGAGDLVFNGGWLGFKDNLDAAAVIRLAPGAGAKAIVRSASRLELDQTQDNKWAARTERLDFVFGADAAAEPSLVSENGAVLYACSFKDAVDGTGKTRVFVRGGMPAHADGRTKAPVLLSAGHNDLQFAKHDAENGLVALVDSDYAAGFGESGVADKAVKVAGTAETVASSTTVGALLLQAAKGVPAAVTIPEDVTLTVGNGTDPAVVAVAPRSGDGSFTLFAGEGRIDFGTSRGVFAVPQKTGTYFQGANAVRTRVSGANGVTFSAMPGDLLNAALGYRNVHYLVSAANDYSGGTVVDMAAVCVTDPLSFSTGPVEVLGGRMSGGAVCFAHAGPFANGFTINGWGRRADEYGDVSQAGALEAMVPGVRLTGRVTVASRARIGAPEVADGEEAIVFEGQVAGERLDLVGTVRTYSVIASAWQTAHHPKFVFTQDNAALTGGVEIISATAVLRGAAPSLGTGGILLDQGAIRFENTAPLACSNNLSGAGGIQLASTQPVTFSGDYSHLASMTLDLCGLRHEFPEFPPFRNWTSSGNTRATIAIKGGLGTVRWPEGLVLDEAGKFDLEIGAGTVLDLGGQTLTVHRGLDGAAKRVTNGTFVELKPQSGLVLIVR